MGNQEQDNSGEQKANSRENVAIPQHQARKDHDPERGDGEERQREKSWQKRFAIFSLVFDGIVAVSAIVGGYFIWEQLNLLRDSNINTVKANAEILREMRSSNEVAGRAFEASNRAYLGLWGMQSTPLEAKDCSVRFQIKNFGNMFAERVGIALAAAVVPKGAAPPTIATQPLWHFPASDLATEIAPDGELDMRLPCWIFDLCGTDLVNKVRTKQSRLYLFWRLTYEDGFGSRVVCKCETYDPSDDRWHPCPAGTKAQCAGQPRYTAARVRCPCAEPCSGATRLTH